MTESTSAEHDGEFGGEWSTNMAKEAKYGLVPLEVDGASALVPLYPGQQCPTSSKERPVANEEGTAAFWEGTESQAGDTMFSVDTPSPFPPSSDLGGGKGDVSERDDPQLPPPRNHCRSGNEMTAGCACDPTRQAQPLFARTRKDARSEAMAVKTELQYFGEALLTEATWPGVTLNIATEIKHDGSRLSLVVIADAG